MHHRWNISCWRGKEYAGRSVPGSAKYKSALLIHFHNLFILVVLNVRCLIQAFSSYLRQCCKRWSFWYTDHKIKRSGFGGYVTKAFCAQRSGCIQLFCRSKKLYSLIFIQALCGLWSDLFGKPVNEANKGLENEIEPRCMLFVSNNSVPLEWTIKFDFYSRGHYWANSERFI